MKATGIVRRIDALGRLVIPMEIRKNMNIKMGEEIEMFVLDGQVVLQKHSSMNKLTTSVKEVVKVLSEITNSTAIATDKDKVIVSYGQEDSLEGMPLSDRYIREISQYRYLSYNGGSCINVIESIELFALLAIPLYSEGDLVGTVGLVSTSKNFAEVDLNTLKIVGSVLTSII